MIHGYADYFGVKKFNRFNEKYLGKFEKILTWIYRNELTSISIKDIDIDEEKAKKLTFAFESDRNKKVRELIFSRNNIGDDEAILLSDILRVNKSIETMIFETNPIGDVGAESLAEALAVSTSLQSLAIRHPKPRMRREVSVRFEGAFHFAEALKINTSLLTLDLNGNKVGDRGSMQIAGALQLNKTLEVLDLRYNGISDRGATALAKSIKDNADTALLSLLLDGNSIGDQGTYSIFDSLSKNSSLRKVSLSLNNMSSPYSRRTSLAMSKALSTNSSVTELDLSYNNIEEDTAQEIKKALLSNTSLTRLKLKEEYKDYFDKIIERNNQLVDAKLDMSLSADDVWAWNRSKVHIVGCSGAGKTSTVRSLLGESFQPRRVPTTGVSISTVVTKRKRSPWELLPSSVFTSKQGALIALQNLIGMKDTESVRLSERAKRAQFADSRRQFNTQTEHSRIEKASLHKYEDIKAEIKTYEMDDLLDALKVEEQIQFYLHDYGSESLSYSVQHLFFRSHGIYLIVFNTSRLLSKRFESSREASELEFWIHSARLHLRRAPIFLVGTHFDRFKDNKKDWDILKARVAKLVESETLNIVKNTRRNLEFFPVNNRSKKGVKTLKNHIEEEAGRLEHINTKIPLSWMISSDNIFGRRTELPWLWMSEVREISFISGVTTEAEIADMLEFFHSQGIVVYFRDSVSLQERVILDQQWLVEAVSIDRRLANLDFAALDRSRLENDLDGLLTNGIATIDILEYLCDKKEIHFILELMQRLFLLSKWQFGRAEKYLIPSMIRSSKGELSCKGFKAGMNFAHTLLPAGIFERLVCLAVADSASIRGSPEPKLGLNICRLFFGPNCPVCFEMEKYNIYMWVENGDAASQCLTKLVSFARKLREDLSLDLEWQIGVVPASGALMVDYNLAKRQKLAPWFDKKELEGQVRKESIDSFLEIKPST